MDESTLSEAQRKNLQSFRDTYKLDNVLDFDGNKGREVSRCEVAGSASKSGHLPCESLHSTAPPFFTQPADVDGRTGRAAAAAAEEEDPDYDPLDDAEDLAVEQTRWSGQAGLDVAQPGSSNWADVAARPMLALGDAGFLLAFATLGRSIHTGGLTLDVGALVAAAPFLGAWFLVTPLLGAYTPNATRSTVPRACFVCAIASDPKMAWSVGPDDQSLTNPIDRMLAQGDALGAVVKAWAVAVPLGLVGRGIIKVRTHTYARPAWLTRLTSKPRPSIPHRATCRPRPSSRCRWS